MGYVSTRGRTPETSLREALFQGLAPDGGLFFPASIPTFTRQELDSLLGSPWPVTASTVARRLLGGDVASGAVKSLVEDALDFPVPLVRLTDRIHLLDLTRGPTLAFKDVGARFMARLMAFFRPEGGGSLTILTATSGDTGGAVANAFLCLPGIRVVVLFPDGKVSPRQERQFSTLGENVRAVAVQGDFDDCQRMAKEAFSDSGLRASLSLTSANSINVGRLLPQSFYYFHAWGALREGRKGTTGLPLLFSVPSGNFGNLAAGLLAKAMGLPDVQFLAATNANDSVPEYLKTGHFRPIPSQRTLSTAMDVGDPSNLARILHLYSGDLSRLRADLTGTSVSDEETSETILRVRDRTGTILDPHTAVGFSALERELKKRPGTPGVLLATASPAKFAEVLEPILGEALPVPQELARGMEGERKVIPMEPSSETLKEFLLAPDSSA